MAKQHNDIQGRLENREREGTLSDLRARIDQVDRRILKCLNQRAELVDDVGALKRTHEMSIYSSGRERDLVATLVGENSGPFPDEAISPVFREIVSATRLLERRLRVGYLGPDGTFSHMAALDTFGQQVELVAFVSLPEVFAAVVRGRVDHALVPVENSTEGFVTETLDLLLEERIPIIGERLLRISLCLMSRSGRLKDIKRVASHPQPLAQARGWLDRQLPKVERLEMSSTMAAVRFAAENEDVGAIGAALGQEIESLVPVARGIEDRRDNTTRFLVLGGASPPPSGSDLTSVVFVLRKDQSGALHRLLGPFARHKVNLTSIHSRPLRGAAWEYLFFVDAEGHNQDEHVAAALEDSGSMAHSMQILGSFPRAVGSRPERDA